MPDRLGALTGDEFAALMAPLGPFGPAPLIAAGVSGGPHSLALALLADRWAVARGGRMLALIADHGLRADSTAEAASVAAMLTGRGIRSRILPLGLSPGAALQDTARTARREALFAACRAAGTPWLLLGHHRGDQAETVLFRALRGSRPAGLAAMPGARADAAALVLRPLLDIPPARLEAVVAAAGLRPVRDPSNADPRFARIALRRTLDDADGTGPATLALAAAAAAFADRRGGWDAAVAARLAASTRIHAEGHAAIDLARLGDDSVADAALAVLLRAVAGAMHAPALEAVHALRQRGQGTLGGAWLRPGRGGWWLLREPAAVTPPVPAIAGALWDGRFRLLAAAKAASTMPGAALGALGAADAAALRPWAPDLPAAVLAGLPAIRCNGVLAAAPVLGYPDAQSCAAFPLVFAPGAGAVAGGAEWRCHAAHLRPALPTLSMAGSIKGIMPKGSWPGAGPWRERDMNR